VRTIAHQMLTKRHNVHLIEPLDYQPFIALMMRSYIILSDSGGVQEEAPSLGKPVLVMRDKTERIEAVAAGTVRLVGTDRDRITQAAFELLDSVDAYRAMSNIRNPYGDGTASQKILDTLLGMDQRC
jgi:UDP-N-acetylglucosamine 2-epimerase (non-hydrolysing)